MLDFVRGMFPIDVYLIVFSLASFTILLDVCIGNFLLVVGSKSVDWIMMF